MAAEDFTEEGSMGEVSTAAILAGIATLPVEVTTVGGQNIVDSFDQNIADKVLKTSLTVWIWVS
jgi:hypothetical protein